MSNIWQVVCAGNRADIAGENSGAKEIDREKEDMQMSKGIVKGIILGAVFIVAVVLFGFSMNHTNEDLTAEMKEATLPVVNFYYQDEQINELFGYVTEMEASYMRDSITPVDSKRILPMKIQTYGYLVDGISYEIRSLDTERLIADSDITDYTSEKGIIRTDLEIQNLLEDGAEYLFILKLRNGENTVYYYTRLIEPADCYVKESLDFVKNFHDTTFNKGAAGTLATYVEPNAAGDNSTLNKVDIHSTLNQISWADFKGQRMGETEISIKEIHPSYNVIMLSYIMSSKSENGELEYYNAKEYYRVRHSTERMFLLNFERNMTQIFRGENNHFYGNRVQLGIRDGEIEYMANENGTNVCFVQEGELWSYQAAEEKLSQVFSFRSYEGMDCRENNPRHDIRMIKVDETGSVDFVVYGYMNRGNHEGEVGIGVYHYSSVENTVEEELFIPYTKSYEIMKAELGQMMYENEDNQFYIILGDSLYEISMNTLEYKVIKDRLEEGGYAVSESNQYAAWLDEGKLNCGTTVYVRNLETGTSFEVTAEAGEYIKPLGFMENDFIYGTAKQSDVVRDAAGNEIFPMYRVCIMDTEGSSHEIIKEYQKAGYYVTGIEIVDYTIYLNRIMYNGTAYADADEDTIMNRNADAGSAVETALTVTEEKQTQYQLVLKSANEIHAGRLMTPKQIVVEESKELPLEREQTQDHYYAYARGEVLMATKNVAKAIQIANENMGVVLGDSQQYIWKRGKKTYQPAIEVSVGEAEAQGSTVAQCLSAMLGLENLNVGVQGLLERGDLPKEILSETMQGMTVLDLTGCGLEEALYYVNCQTPVFAMYDGNHAVLITGYDSRTVTIYDTSSAAPKRENLKDAAEQFEQAGNLFIAYLKN